MAALGTDNSMYDNVIAPGVQQAETDPVTVDAGDKFLIDQALVVDMSITIPYIEKEMLFSLMDKSIKSGYRTTDLIETYYKSDYLFDWLHKTEDVPTIKKFLDACIGWNEDPVVSMKLALKSRDKAIPVLMLEQHELVFASSLLAGEMSKCSIV